jgi:hypothetical protein
MLGEVQNSPIAWRQFPVRSPEPRRVDSACDGGMNRHLLSDRCRGVVLRFSDYLERSNERDRVGAADASGVTGPSPEATPPTRPTYDPPPGRRASRSGADLAPDLRGPRIGDVSPTRPTRITRELRQVYRIERPLRMGEIIDAIA